MTRLIEGNELYRLEIVNDIDELRIFTTVWLVVDLTDCGAWIEYDHSFWGHDLETRTDADRQSPDERPIGEWRTVAPATTKRRRKWVKTTTLFAFDDIDEALRSLKRRTTEYVKLSRRQLEYAEARAKLLGLETKRPDLTSFFRHSTMDH